MAVRLGWVGGVLIALGMFSFSGGSLQAQSLTAVPGKFESGKCAVYASSLQKKMGAKGRESTVLIYEWKSFGNTGRHAIVVFRDEQGRHMAIDNEHQTPVEVKGSTPDEWARAFSRAKRVNVVASYSQSGSAMMMASN
jgi:hypothetical protein